MLKTASARFTAVNRPTEPVAVGSREMAGGARERRITDRNNHDVDGRSRQGHPELLLGNIRHAFRATPPIGSRVMSRVWMPNRLTVSA